MLPRAHIFRQTTVQFLSIFIVFNTYRIQNSMASKSQSESSSSQLMSSSSQKEGGTSLKRKNNFFYTVSFWRSRCPGVTYVGEMTFTFFFYIYFSLSLYIYIYISSDIDFSLDFHMPKFNLVTRTHSGHKHLTTMKADTHLQNP